MTDQHPITPPPELVQQWANSSPCQYSDEVWAYELFIATQAARWGADQQLELDAKWLDHNALNEAHLKIVPMGDALKEAMCPKPPSLKEQAFDALKELSNGIELPDSWEIIRCALEALPE